MKISHHSALKSVGGEQLEFRRLLAADLVPSQLVDFSSFRSNAEIEFQDVQEGDFDGDGQIDIVGRHEGQWWVGRSGAKADEFRAEHWATWSDVDWTDVWAADFNGDGLDDLAGRIAGDWWVAMSTGERFLNQHWGEWSNNVDWSDVCVGDFNNDGLFDIAGQTGGHWWVARSTGEKFLNEYWGDELEHDDPHSAQVFASSINADLNNDGTVGFDDFIILSANYQRDVAAGSNGDLDGNAVVNFQDFLILREQYVV